MLMTFNRVLYFTKNVPNNVRFVNIFDKKYEKQSTGQTCNLARSLTNDHQYCFVYGLSDNIIVSKGAHFRHRINRREIC